MSDYYYTGERGHDSADVLEEVSRRGRRASRIFSRAAVTTLGDVESYEADWVWRMSDDIVPPDSVIAAAIAERRYAG